jgi:hypothetical protein
VRSGRVAARVRSRPGVDALATRVVEGSNPRAAGRTPARIADEREARPARRVRQGREPSASRHRRTASCAARSASDLAPGPDLAASRPQSCRMSSAVAPPSTGYMPTRNRSGRRGPRSAATASELGRREPRRCGRGAARGDRPRTAARAPVPRSDRRPGVPSCTPPWFPFADARCSRSSWQTGAIRPAWPRSAANCEAWSIVQTRDRSTGHADTRARPRAGPVRRRDGAAGSARAGAGEHPAGGSRRNCARRSRTCVVRSHATPPGRPPAAPRDVAGQRTGDGVSSTVPTPRRAAPDPPGARRDAGDPPPGGPPIP